MNEQNAVKLASQLVLAWPSWSVTDEHANVWADELQRMSEHEGQQVVRLLIDRSTAPPSVAQIRQAQREVLRQTMSPSETGGCVYIDGVECPSCNVVHGHLISGGTALHGAHHLADHFKGKAGALEVAKHPERCDCGFVEPPNIDIQKVIEDLVVKDMVKSWASAVDDVR